jgi:hypothetical protein
VLFGGNVEVGRAAARKAHSATRIVSTNSELALEQKTMKENHDRVGRSKYLPDIY